MQVWRGVEQVPADLGPTACTIGNFDGVHRGHRALLRRLTDRAHEEGLPAVAVTFDPHPARVHRPEQAPPLLTGPADRLELLAERGLDAVLVLPYTLELARHSPEEFVRRFLLGVLHAAAVVVGEDTRFGWQNSGDRHTMAALGAGLGFAVDVVEDVVEGERRWSSSWVRELLAAGDVAGAAHVLGRWHRLRGVVVTGERRGRELGYPTANLGPGTTGFVPADGVYAGWLAVSDEGPRERLPAAVSIGTNPTFAGTARVVEAHVLGRTDLDLYGREVVVELVERLRPMVRFEGVAPLVAQMADDVADAARVLAV